MVRPKFPVVRKVQAAGAAELQPAFPIGLPRPVRVGRRALHRRVRPIDGELVQIKASRQLVLVEGKVDVEVLQAGRKLGHNV